MLFRHIDKEKCEKFWLLYFIVLHLHANTIKIMATTARIPASFRFQSTLLDELKAKAKASNRSLNNYVESLLISVLHPSTAVEDNIITPELQKKIDKAMEEYRNGETRHFETATEMNSWLDSL